MSGDFVGILDPHETIIDRNPRRTGKVFTMNEFCSYPAQMEPFRDVLGFSPNQYYDGTLFRFPFRNGEFQSAISDRVYTPKEAEGVLYGSLAEEAQRILLFLNNVMTVELYSLPQGSYDRNRQLLLKISVTPHEVCAGRQWCRDMCLQYERSANVPVSSHVNRCTVSVSGPLARSHGTYTWLMCNTIGARNSTMRDLATKIKVVPWIGLAAPLSPVILPGNHQFQSPVLENCSTIEQSVKSSVSKNVQAINWGDPPSTLSNGGFAYCFLPMSTTSTTGLPLHVHGYFSLSDNRRRVRWPDADDKSDEAMWNQYLMEQLIAPSYAILVTARCSLTRYRGFQLSMDSLQSNKDPYALLPLLSVTKETSWRHLVQCALPLLAQLPVLWTPVNGGQWIESSKAYFVPRQFPLTVANFLLQLNCPIVHLPSNIQQDSHVMVQRMLSPQVTRNYIRKAVSHATQILCKNINLLCDVLRYVTSDGTGDLQGLPLIPLKQANTVNTFTSPYEAAIYVQEQNDNLVNDVLFGLDDIVVSTSIPSDLKRRFGEIAASRQYQLQLANANVVCSQLLSQSMQKWCSPNANQVQWCIGQYGHPPSSWLSSVWRYIAQNRQLNYVTGLPLVAVQGPDNLPNRANITLHALNCNGTLFRNNPYCSQELCAIAQNLGCTIVNDSHLYAPLQSDLNRLLPMLSPQTFFTAMQSLFNVQRNVARLSTSYKRALRGILVQAVPSPNGNTRRFLQSLPLCEIGVGNAQTTFCAPNTQVVIFPSSGISFPHSLPFPWNILNLQTSTDEQFYCSVLGRQPLSLGALVSQSIFNHAESCNATIRNRILVWIIGNTNPYARSEVENFVLSKRCVPNTQNTLCFVSELYDPNDSKLKEYFHSKEAAFPADDFRPVLYKLQQFGLKTWSSVTNNISSFNSFLVDRAKSVSFLRIQGLDQEAKKRSRLLLQEVTNSPHCTHLLNSLSDVRFLYCQQSPPRGYISSLAWAGSSCTQLFSLKQLFFTDSICYTASLVGSVRPILSEEYMDSIVRLGGNTQFCASTSNQDVLKHFQNIVSLQIRHPKEISYMVEHIYKWLQINSPTCFESCSYPFIWNESIVSHFLHRNQVALEPLTERCTLAPYRYCCKDLRILERYVSMWKCCGVKKSFTEEDGVAVVCEIRKQTSGKLCQSDLDIVVNVAKVLSDRERHDLIPSMYLPSHRNTLESPSELTYHDFYVDLTGSEDDDFLFVHHDITSDVARFFKVKSLSTRAVHSEPLGIKYECTGPYESITHRIHEAVEEYGDQIDVFKELIQNADDAGATVVKFLIDWRDWRGNQGSKLLTKEMKTWQGPALYAYNDKTFSDDDLKNICKVAGETKKLDVKKIGRFGIGFCATYHITDVPSFVTRQFLQIFDPHLKYLGDRVKSTEPGMLINFVRERGGLQKYFGSQLEPYQGVFGCDLFNCGQDGFQGTLFRFPFRQQGVISEISSDVFAQNSKAVESLKQSLIGSSRTLLLFLQNVNRVELYECDGISGTPKNVKMERLFSISKSGVDSQVFQKNFKICENFSSISPCSQVVQIASQCQSSGSEVHNWIVSSAMGKKASLYFATGQEGKSKGLVPMAEVALEVVKKGNQLKIIKSTRGGISCFLPLPITTSLSFHVNAYFDVSKDRKLLKGVQGSEQDKWNIMLMADALLEAVLTLFEFLTGNAPCGSKEGMVSFLNDYYSLFPVGMGNSSSVVDSVQPYLSGAFEKEFLVIARKLIWCSAFGGCWMRPCDVVVLSHEYPLTGAFWDTAFDLLVELAIPIAKVPTNLNHLFKDNSVSFRTFCEEHVFRELNDLPIGSRDTIVLHFLKNYDTIVLYHPWIEELLKGTPCIPTKPSGVLCRPSDLVDASNRILKVLFDEEEGRFPVDTYLEMVSLKRLGMAHGRLRDDDVINRAKTVCILHETEGFDTALQRSKCVVNYLTDYHRDSKTSFPSEKDKQLFTSLSSVPFLLSAQRPEGSTVCWLKWTPFLSAQQLYLPEYSNLVFTQYPVVNHGTYEFDRNLSRMLTFLSNPDTNTVIQQLKNLVTWWTGGGKENKTNEDDHLLSEATNALYSHLHPRQHSYFSKTDKIEAKQLDFIKEQLDGLPFVWENGFYHVDQVFTEELHCCPPYMVKLTHHVNFFVKVGVKKRASSDQLIDMLVKIKEDHEEQPLSDELVDLCVAIATRLSLEENQSEDLCLPDCDGIMRCRPQLMYMDERDYTWLCKHDAFDGITGEVFYLHKNISWTVAMNLGLSNPIQALLEQYVDNAFMNGIEYGQAEDLCDRLSNILHGYHADSSIFKEFIQNADDAGASEIAFVLDRRKFKDKKLLSQMPHWKKLQQMPSLLVFNNKKFSDADIRSITRLGRGGKQDTPATIGRFGIGFNVAYHITDCPVFVSHSEGGAPEHFCVFDPTLQYAPGSSKSHPGRRWELSKKQGDLTTLFVDQMQPFSEETLELLSRTCQGSFPQLRSDNKWENGFVIFRLPLTREREVLPKKINKGYKMTQVHLRQLMDDFVDEAGQMLLFLNCVRRISLFEITGDNRCTLLGSFHADLTPNSECLCHDFNSKVTNEIKMVKMEKCTKSLSTVYRLAVNCAQREVVTDEKGAKRFNMKISSEEWIVSKRFGGQDVDETLLATGFRCSFLPLGGVAARLPLGRGLYDHSSRSPRSLYCYLPLPLESHLPVHVNGHFWLNDSRRNLQHSKGDHELKEWNAAVCNDICAKAYVDLLLYCRGVRTGEDSQFNPSWYYGLFPNCTIEGPLENFNLPCRVYSLLVDQNAPVLLVKKENEDDECVHPQWLALSNSIHSQKGLFYKEPSSTVPRHEVSQARFLASSGMKESRSSEDDKPKDLQGVILLKLGLNLTSAPFRIATCVQTSLNQDYTGIIIPASVREHLRSLSPQLEKYRDIIVENILSLLKYCLSDVHQVTKNSQTPIWQAILNGIPLMLTEDSCLKEMCEVFDGRYSKLLPHCSQQFISQTIWKCSGLATHLEHLGVIKPLIEQPSYVSTHLNLRQNVGVVSFDTASKDLLALLWKYIRNIHHRELYHFNCFSIIPTTDNHLYPFSQANMVLFEQPIRKLITLFGFPIVDFGKIFPKYQEFGLYSDFQSHFAHETVPDILRLLEHYQHDVVLRNITPEESDVTEFIRFLEESEVFSQQSSHHLKKLPLFKLVSGELKPIDTYASVHGIHNSFPKDGLAELSAIVKTVQFVVVPPFCDEFMRNVGVTLWKDNELQFYRYHLVPLFHVLPDEMAPQLLKAQVELLFELFCKLGYTKKTRGSWNIIFGELQRIPFISSPQGAVCVRDLYDPEEELLKTFLPSDSFPPQPWMQGEHMRLDFLRHIGLIQTVSCQLWLQFANILAEEIQQSGDKSEMDCKSHLLLESLHQKVQKNVSVDFCTKASQIVIAPCEPQDHLERTIQTVLNDAEFRLPHQGWTKLSGCVVANSSSDYLITCLVKPCLAIGYSFSSDSSQEVLDKLGMSKHNSVLVAQNLICLSQHLQRCKEIPVEDRFKLVTKLEKLFEAHYKYINDSEGSEDTISEVLHNKKCIFLPTSFLLLSAEQVCLPSSTSVDIYDLTPYVLPVPHYCLTFSHFLKLAGVSEELSIPQCLFVLRRLIKKYKNRDLYPNDWKSALVAYKHLIYLCRKVENEDLPLAEQLTVHTGEIPLPSIDRRLLPSTQLVLDDASWIGQRIDASAVQIALVHRPPKDEFSYHTLPDCLGVRLLSRLITEHPHEQMLHPANMCNAESVARAEGREHGCQHVIALNNIIFSNELYQAVLRIVRHETRQVPSDELADRVRVNLQRIDVKCVQMIKTVLHNEQGQLIQSSENEDISCFVTSDDDDSSRIAFIAPHSDSLNPTELLFKLSKGLNLFLGQIIKDNALLIQMLSCQGPEVIPIVLDRLCIPAYEHGTEAQPQESDIGQPALNRGRLDYLILCTFRTGEIVKYLNDAGNWINAEVKEVSNVDNQLVECRLQVGADTGEDGAVIEVTSAPMFMSKYLSTPQATYIKRCWKLPSNSEEDEDDGTTPHEPLSFLSFDVSNPDGQCLADQLGAVLNVLGNSVQREVYIRLIYHLDYLCVKNDCARKFRSVADVYIGLLRSLNIRQDIIRQIEEIVEELINSRMERQPSASSFGGGGGSLGHGGGGGGVGYMGGGGGGGAGRRHHRGGIGSGFGGLQNPVWRPRGANRYHDSLWQPPTVEEPPPQPNITEARMWLTQSLNDFEAAKSLLTTSIQYRQDHQGHQNHQLSVIHMFPAQVCFLCHESVEKCLKALFLALYGMNRQLTGHTNVKDLCEELQRNPHWSRDPPINLMPQVLQVSSHYLCCRYPDYNVPMMEPARVYVERFQDAEDVVMAVGRILETVQQIDSIAELMREVMYTVPVQRVDPIDPHGECTLICFMYM